MTRICLTPQVSGVGGMVSFRAKFTAGLQQRGIEVTNDLTDEHLDAVLVIGGTRMLGQLLRVKRRGVRIVQRLDGMNWIHRVHKTGAKHYLRSEYGNWNLHTIRDHLAERVVYQSEFSRSWWFSKYGPSGHPNQVIRNGVDLDVFKPDAEQSPPADRWRLLMIEGSLAGGYEAGLESALGLANGLAQNSDLAKPIELVILGKVSESLRASCTPADGVDLVWRGVLPHEEIPEINRQSHLLFSSDINPACPNSVIEALACGLPVLAYDTGALPELVGRDAGEIVPYGGDPWKLEKPDIPALVDGAARILKDQAEYGRSARRLAEQAFGLDKMVDDYLEFILG